MMARFEPLYVRYTEAGTTLDTNGLNMTFRGENVTEEITALKKSHVEWRDGALRDAHQLTVAHEKAFRLAQRAEAAEVENERLRSLLRRFALEHHHLGHHGSCCKQKGNSFIVTPESCVCYPIEREVYFELGDFKDTLCGWGTAYFARDNGRNVIDVRATEGNRDNNS